MTTGLFLLIVYIISVIVCGVLHWAEYLDTKVRGSQSTLHRRIVYLYLIPLIPILNLYIIALSIAAYLD